MANSYITQSYRTFNKFMKNLFPGYYTPTDDEFKLMWQECIFAFDANMLLNIYRYTPKTQESFFLILDQLKDRIWIPHQAAAEYYKRRLDVINGQLKSYDEITSKIDLIFENLKSQLVVYKKHASVNIEQVFEELESGIKKAKISLEKDKQNHPDLSFDDPLRDKIADLFNQKVGNPFNEKQLLDIYGKAKQRFEVLKPPGFKTSKGKEYPDIYGDVVIWFQLIEYAKKEKKPLIFITDDRKEDWWQKEAGQTICPRPELTAEIWSAAQVSFYMYHSDQFIKFALDFLNIGDQQSAVEEVQEIRKQDEAKEILKDYYTDALRNNAFGINAIASSFAPLLKENVLGANRAFANSIAPLMSEIDASLKANVAPFLKNYAAEINATVANSVVPLFKDNSSAIDSALKGLTPSIHESIFGRNSALIAGIAPLARNTALEFNAASQFSGAITAHNQYIENLRIQGLLGRHISRGININISPIYSSEMPKDEESNEVYIEALVNDVIDNNSENEQDEEIENSESTNNTQPYEFDNFPLTVTLIHHEGSANSYETLHKLRNPTIDEWYQWGNEIEQTRRYSSLKEIKEQNDKKDSEEEEITESYNSFYSEMDASDSLYNKIILEIAGVVIDEEDNFPSDRFRKIDSELIKKNSFEFSEIVITELYECYCWRGKTANKKGNQILIHQKIVKQKATFVINHILQIPTKKESNNFRTQIIKGYFSKDDENQEIIELKLNLPVAVDFYNKQLINIENAFVKGKSYSKANRADFLEQINPVYKFRVLSELLNINAWNFKIDDIVLG